MARDRIQSTVTAANSVRSVASVSPVECALNGSQDSVSRLVSSIQELRDRLSAVMTPGDPGIDENSNGPRPVVCSIAESALTIGRTADAGCELVQDIINRLQV